MRRIGNREKHHRNHTRHLKRPQRVLLTGYFNRGNLGDDAMREGLETFIAAHHSDADIRWTQLPSASRQDVHRWIPFCRSLAWADVVILAGGTHFQDRYGLRSLRILASHLGVFSFARLTRASVGYAGIGIGPLKTRAGRIMTKILLRLSSATLVRDDPSRILGQSLSRQASIVTGFDSAILIPRPESPKSDDKFRIGVSILPYFELYKNSPERDRQVVSEIATALEQLHSIDPRVTVRVLVFYDGERDSDVPISKHLVSHLQATVPVELVRCTEPSATMTQLAELDALIAMRYHATLLGYAVGCPTLVLSYQDKCIALAQEIGINGSAILEPEDLLSGEQFVTELKALKRDPGRYRATQPLDTAIARSKRGLITFAARVGLRSIDDES